MNTQAMRNWISHPETDPVRFSVMKRDAREVSMRAFHRARQYFLYLDLTGRGLHHCSCRDFDPQSLFFRKVRAMDLFCRHIVAAARNEGRMELLLSVLTRTP